MLFIDQPNQVGFSYSVPVPAFESNLGSIVALPLRGQVRVADGRAGRVDYRGPFGIRGGDVPQADVGHGG